MIIIIKYNIHRLLIKIDSNYIQISSTISKPILTLNSCRYLPIYIIVEVAFNQSKIKYEENQ